MGRTTDFRLYPFDPRRVEASGKFVGHHIYWKLYLLENIFRIIINSVLSVQIGPDWWDVAVDDKIRKRAVKFKKDYLRRPWYTKPGSHDIYYIYLRDLSEIMRANSNLFLPVIPDIDSWIARVEQILLPRNIVGHMNFPSETDQKRIDVFYSDSKILLTTLQTSLLLQVP